MRGILLLFPLKPSTLGGNFGFFWSTLFFESPNHGWLLSGWLFVKWTSTGKTNGHGGAGARRILDTPHAPHSTWTKTTMTTRKDRITQDVLHGSRRSDRIIQDLSDGSLCGVHVLLGQWDNPIKQGSLEYNLALRSWSGSTEYDKYDQYHIRASNHKWYTPPELGSLDFTTPRRPSYGNCGRCFRTGPMGDRCSGGCPNIHTAVLWQGNQTKLLDAHYLTSLMEAPEEFKKPDWFKEAPEEPNKPEIVRFGTPCIILGEDAIAAYSNRKFNPNLLANHAFFWRVLNGLSEPDEGEED